MATPAEMWKNKASYDMDTARAMLEAGRYLYVLFCCQQAVEKFLKGLIAERTATHPPRIHQLVRLAGLAEVHASVNQQDFMRELSAFYIQTRYPEEIAAAEIARETAVRTLSETEEFIEWLKSMS